MVKLCSKHWDLPLNTLVWNLKNLEVMAIFLQCHRQNGSDKHKHLDFIPYYCKGFSLWLPMGQIWPTFVNEIFLEHSLTHIFIYCPELLYSTIEELKNCKSVSTQNLKYLRATTCADFFILCVALSNMTEIWVLKQCIVISPWLAFSPAFSNDFISTKFPIAKLLVLKYLEGALIDI